MTVFASPVSKAPGSASGAGVSFYRPHVACAESGHSHKNAPSSSALGPSRVVSLNDFLARDLPIKMGGTRATCGLHSRPSLYPLGPWFYGWSDQGDVPPDPERNLRRGEGSES